MVERDPARTKPPIHERAEYRFGLVLMLLLATFLVMSSGATGTWTRPVTVGLESSTLLAALYAARVPVRMQRIAQVVVVLAFVASLIGMRFHGDAPGAAVAILNALLVGAAPIAIAWSIVRRGTIDIQTVLGALCIYVLIGMLFAFVYTAIGAIQTTPFFVQTNDPDPATFLYFSFITQTTVGYGDYTAATNAGRSLAVLEALTGQVYLVTVVAVLVSNLVPRRSSRRGDADS